MLLFQGTSIDLNVVTTVVVVVVVVVVKKIKQQYQQNLSTGFLFQATSNGRSLQRFLVINIVVNKIIIFLVVVNHHRCYYQQNHHLLCRHQHYNYHYHKHYHHRCRREQNHKYKSVELGDFCKNECNLSGFQLLRRDFIVELAAGNQSLLYLTKKAREVRFIGMELVRFPKQLQGP